MALGERTEEAQPIRQGVSVPVLWGGVAGVGMWRGL